MTRPKSTCLFDNCDWKDWWDYSGYNCYTYYEAGYISSTQDLGNGNTFTSEYETYYSGTWDYCFCCQTPYTSSTWICSGKIWYTVATCSSFITLSQPSSSYSYTVTDTTASQQYTTLWAGFASFVATSDSTSCGILRTSLYYNANSWSSSYSTQWTTSSTNTYLIRMIYDAGSIGETNVYTDVAWSGSFKISIGTSSYTTTTNAFTIYVTCGLSSTTISNTTGLEYT